LKKIEKKFHAQGIRPSESVEPNTFSPFNPRVETKSIGEKFYFTGAHGRVFIAEWEKRSITYPRHGAEVQAIIINL
jgi:hypothetical protein